MWVAGLRGGVLYKVAKRPLDPRWSQADLQTLLGLCATGQHLGWADERAFQAAEALIFKKKLFGVTWANDNLTADMALLVSGVQHEAQKNEKEENCMEKEAEGGRAATT